MSKVVVIDAELERDGKFQKVKVRALTRPLMAEGGTVFIRDMLDKLLGFVPGQPRVEDGNYMMQFYFNGEKQEYKHRVEGGELRGGWVTKAAG
jgi:hypothetical protein